MSFNTKNRKALNQKKQMKVVLKEYQLGNLRDFLWGRTPD